jgi:uncharacterized protein (TIGR00251 family)
VRRPDRARAAPSGDPSRDAALRAAVAADGRHGAADAAAAAGASLSADLRVRLQPRASRNEIVGARDGVLVVRVTAPPVDGKANAALCALLARAAGVAPSRVAVVRGQTARDKVVRVDGMEEAALRAAVGLPGSP